MVDEKNDHEDEDVAGGEEVTDKLVVVELQLLLGVPAVAIVSHRGKICWSFKYYVLSWWLLKEH